jgi:hypothetical protein
MTVIDQLRTAGPLLPDNVITEVILEVGIIVLLAVTIPTLFQVVRLASELRSRLARIEERLADISQKTARAD